MKRMAIIFAIVFTATALIPLAAYLKGRESAKTNEMVTIFSAYDEDGKNEISKT